MKEFCYFVKIWYWPIFFLAFKSWHRPQHGMKQSFKSAEMAAITIRRISCALLLYFPAQRREDTHVGFIYRHKSTCVRVELWFIARAAGIVRGDLVRPRAKMLRNCLFRTFEVTTAVITKERIFLKEEYYLYSNLWCSFLYIVLESEVSWVLLIRLQ